HRRRPPVRTRRAAPPRCTRSPTRFSGCPAASGPLGRPALGTADARRPRGSPTSRTVRSQPVRIDHVALWTPDLERSRAFYERWFGARAGARYENPTRGFASYFLDVGGGVRLELMQQGGEIGSFAHVAVALGSEAAVDELTERMRAASIPVESGPRRTGDG